MSGEPAAGREHCDEGRRLYDFERHRSHAMVYGGHDPGVCARILGGLTGWLLGYLDQSRASIADGLELAERLGHPFTLGIALLQATVFHQLCREPDNALRRLHAAETVATEQRHGLHIDFRILRGGALTAQSESAEAVAAIRDGLADRQRAGGKLYRPFGLAIFAEALACAGDHVGACSALAEALAIAQETGERWWEAEIHRLNGVTHLASLDIAEAEVCFRHASAIARQQQAKSLELRAATSLARLWGEQGRRAEARELLAPVYGWFTEGFDTADLKEAKGLLDELT